MKLSIYTNTRTICSSPTYHTNL